MLEKAKYMVLALGITLVLLFFLLLVSKQQLAKVTQEKNSLQSVKVSLESQIKALEDENGRFKEKIASITQDVESLNSQKDELSKKFESLLDERNKQEKEIDKLQDQLARAKKAAESSQQEPTFFSSKNEEYWASVLKKKETLELQMANMQNDLSDLRIANEKLNREKRNLEIEISTFNRDSEDFLREFEYNKKLVDSLSKELAREKSDKFSMEETVKSMRAENKYLKQQMRSLDDNKIALENRLAALQARNNELEVAVAKMETFVRQRIVEAEGLKEDLGMASRSVSFEEEARNKLASLRKDAKAQDRSSVELQPIIVRPQEAAFSSTIGVKKANVLALNRENNFVIINAGENAGIKAGDRFRVFNLKEELVANIEVIQVRKEISACDIKEELSPITVGDSVR